MTPVSSSIMTPVPDGLTLILHTPNLFAAVKYVGIKSVRAPHSVPLMAMLIFLDSWFNNVSSPAVYIVVYTDAAVQYSGRIVK